MSAWAKAATKPSYTYTEVGAQVAGTYATGTGSATGTNTGDQVLPTLSSLGAQASLGFTPYNATNPSSFVSQAGITALPLSQLASTLDMGTVP